MKLTHGEIRGLTALAILLMALLMLVWVTKGCSGQSPSRNSDDTETVKEFIASSDSVATVAGSASDIKHIRKSRKNTSKKHSTPPQSRHSPLDRGID